MVLFIVSKSLLNLSYKSKNILLLQGPVGPFFYNLKKDLILQGNTVYKINFNAGDCFFYPEGYCFTESLEEFPQFLLNFVTKKKIDAIVLFGDCRPIHLQALNIIKSLNLDIFVFEEGYIRPNHITLEQVGVNGNSLLPKNAEYYLSQSVTAPHYSAPVGKTFWHTTYWAILYYFAASFGYFKFRLYQHHRPLHIGEGLYWVRGTFRKWKFKYKEKGIEEQLTSSLKHKYFLVPLQLPGDSQVTHHSRYSSIQEFFSAVMTSFAKHAPKDTFLVIRQHPLDRGYNDYSSDIQNLAILLGIHNRTLYIHDQNLPQLLRNARGIVVINSTVGLSALYHHTPTKVCGEAIYDTPQLCYQGTLDSFWEDAEHFEVNRALFKKYINYLENRCQINGSFYKKFKFSPHHSGLNLNNEEPINQISKKTNNPNK